MGFDMNDLCNRLLSYEEQVVLQLGKSEEKFNYFLLKEVLKKVDDLQEFTAIIKRFSDKYSDFKRNGYQIVADLDLKSDFEIAIENKLLKQNFGVRISSDTGIFLAYLIGQKIQIIELLEEYKFLKPFFRRVISELDLQLTRYSQLLRSQFESSYFHIPLEKALNCFLIFDKDKALKIFTKILCDDYRMRRTDINSYETLTIRDLFFSRLGLDFIPEISAVLNEKYSNEHCKFITKQEINKIVDSDDIFNKSYPLDDLKTEQLLNPKFIRHENKILAILQNFFSKDFNFDNNRKLDCPKIFLETISNPYPNYSLQDLQDVRDLIIVQVKNKQKRANFLALLYQFRVRGYLGESSTKFPRIMSSYFGVMNNAESTMKDYLVRDYKKEVNRYNESRDEILNNYFT